MGGTGLRKTVGILAHVDAGKTTFSERVLYLSHAIRTLGRVDHQNAFLDTDPMERQRGITIFSGQACFPLGDDTIYWLDTPGHVDFSMEMERALSVMDYAILVVSSAEGVQSHTETVWRLLRDYRVPTFLFLSKTDREGADPDGVLDAIRRRLCPDLADLRLWQTTGSMDEALQEEIASRDEQLMERFFEGDFDQDDWTAALIRQLRACEVFPVLAGSALTGDGMEGFLHLFSVLTPTDHSVNETGPVAAQVYQIRHDAQGQRLTFMKLLSGTVRVKDELPLPEGTAKINELRVYHGEKYSSVSAACAGDLIAIPGLEGIRPGDFIGREDHGHFRTEPMMAADLIWDEKVLPAFKLLQAVRILEDEDPSLSVDETGGRIAIHVMGQIQLEILHQQLLDRFGYDVSFGPCRVLYKETVAAPSIGIGHYEPLRHYAEVHLRLVPTGPGTGITFRSLAHVDDLALNWHRLIETHVFEKTHKGVLTGSPLTDVRVELLCGRDHLKHTEGGDFRQSTYRAIRNALMYAESVLLEPICGFEVRVPSDLYGAIAGALSRMQADVQPPEYEGDLVTLRGEAVFAVFSAWQNDFMMATHGKGSLRVWMSRYAPCRNQTEVVAAAAYNPLADDTPDSVFCSHGAGFTVAWDKVKDFAHLSHEGI